MSRTDPGPLRSALFAVITTVVVLFGLNMLVEKLEDRGVVDTHRVEDRMLYQEEDLYQLEGEDYVTTAYGREHMVNSTFAARKGPRWRMFMLGASFAQGTPYDCCEADGSEAFGGITTWLRAQYQHLYPGHEAEVINAAAGGTSSQRVVSIAQSVARLEPDVIVVASCNNEGVLSPGTVSEQLHRLGGYRMLTRMLAPAPDPATRSYFTPQNPDSVMVRDQFRKNLEKVVRSTAEQGVPMLLATLPVNLRYRGFEPGPVVDDQRYASTSGACAAAVESFHAGRLEQGLQHLRACDGLPDIQSWIGLAYLRMGRFEQGRLELEKLWGACLATGVHDYFKGDYQAAITALEGCGRPAEALRWIGLSRFELGESDAARADLEQATELMPRNRCRPSFNAIIREIAASAEHVHLVDLEAAARRASPQGIPGPELFVDYCHMNWRGYALMAEELRAALGRAGVGPTWEAAAEPLTIEELAVGRQLSALPASPGPQPQ